MLHEFYSVLEIIIVNAVWVAAVLGWYYDLVRILVGIGHGNISHFCYYNSKHSICVLTGVIWLGLVMGML